MFAWMPWPFCIAVEKFFYENHAELLLRAYPLLYSPPMEIYMNAIGRLKPFCGTLFKWSSAMAIVVGLVATAEAQNLVPHFIDQPVADTAMSRSTVREVQRYFGDAYVPVSRMLMNLRDSSFADFRTASKNEIYRFAQENGLRLSLSQAEVDFFRNKGYLPEGLTAISSVRALPLSTQEILILQSMGVEQISDLDKISVEDLKEDRNLSNRTIHNLQKSLKEFGFGIALKHQTPRWLNTLDISPATKKILSGARIFEPKDINEKSVARLFNQSGFNDTTLREIKDLFVLLGIDILSNPRSPISLHLLNLDRRTFHALKDLGIQRVTDALKFSVSQLRHQTYLSEAAILRARLRFRQAGFPFKEDQPEHCGQLVLSL